MTPNTETKQKCNLSSSCKPRGIEMHETGVTTQCLLWLYHSDLPEHSTCPSGHMKDSHCLQVSTLEEQERKHSHHKRRDNREWEASHRAHKIKSVKIPKRLSPKALPLLEKWQIIDCC